MNGLLEQRDEGAWFAHGGEMADRIRRYDWATTTLGALDRWPNSLRNAVNLVLASPLPTALTWGEQGTQLYNDAFLRILGPRHPRALGQNFDDCWHGAFPGTGLPAHRAAAPGIDDNQRLFLSRPAERNEGQLLETFFTHAVTPVLDERGETAGHLHQLVETTEAALAARRLQVLGEVTRATGAGTLEQCLRDAATALADSGADVPFLLGYTLDPTGCTARLVAGTRLPPGAPECPSRQDVAAADPFGTWPLGAALQDCRPLPVDDVQLRFPGLTAGPYPEPITTAYVVPIGEAGSARAVIVAGVSQRARLDDACRAFFSVLAAVLAAALGDAAARATADENERRRALTRGELEQARSALAKLRNESTDRFAESNEELEAFSYAVSHDLRTPLRAIDGFSRALLSEQGEKLDQRARHHLQRIRAGTQRMAALIDDLLRLSRVARAALRREPLDLSAMARRVLADLAASEPERNVETLVADGLAADADARLVTALLESLLGNAWKFTANVPQARIEVILGSRTGTAHRDVVFVVRDNGAGFDMEYAKKLFQPFQRLHPPSEYPGSGMGLAMVKRIVTRHGGHIWAQSAPGQGATFHFTLGEPS